MLKGFEGFQESGFAGSKDSRQLQTTPTFLRELGPESPITFQAPPKFRLLLCRSESPSHRGQSKTHTPSTIGPTEASSPGVACHLYTKYEQTVGLHMSNSIGRLSGAGSYLRVAILSVTSTF
jgi:hypothetical protein